MPISIDGSRVPDVGELATYVYGSCVSRDLVALMSPSLSCVEYTARQAWISATSPGLKDIPEYSISSSFQRRMIDSDLQSTALEKMEQKQSLCDLTLLDIVDDRFGVYPVGDSYITPSAEFSSSGLRDALSMGRHLDFGEDRHFEIWSESASRVRSSLEPVIDRTFVLAATFTGKSVDGSEVPLARGKSPEEWNDKYLRYYEFLSTIGFQVMQLPDRHAVTTPHHVWGLAPFHYVERAYAWWYERICEVIGQHVR